MKKPKDPVAEAIIRTLESPNETDQNLENANVVDGLFAIARALHHLAESIDNGRLAMYDRLDKTGG